MEIKELSKWTRFYIPIPVNPNETEEDFLRKTKDCLTSFFEKYTKMTEAQKRCNHPFKNASLESIKGEWEIWNFQELELEGILDCNIKFYVGTPKDNYGKIGINILAGNDKPEKKPMMDFLRKKWEEFDYKF
ncbi:MAG: hypothetical protein WC781_01755 [Candidatus Pacearchaeota archaeon]|jgi:hypothetical protein